VVVVPTITISYSRLEELIGRELALEELEDLLFRVKCGIENLSLEADSIEVEISSDRPDLLAPEGLARAIKGLLGIETGCPRLEVVDSGFSLTIESPPSRPYIAVGILYDYRLDDRVLEELIQFQEKLHATIGRNRRKIAIGIHDLSKVPDGNIVYKEVDVTRATMTPLGGSKEVTVREVLEQTTQGEKYGWISLRDKRYHPAIYAGDVLISLPPVINSDVTRLEPGTQGLFIDVTGVDEYTVHKTLDILVSVLSEKEKGRIGRVRVFKGRVEGKPTPQLSRGALQVEVSEINRMLGFRLEPQEVVSLLGKMRWDARVLSNGRIIEAEFPEYRIDILHPVDVIEDVAVAYGYDRIPLTRPLAMLKPKRLELPRFARLLARVVAGLGFLELLTFIMVPRELSELSLEGIYKDFGVLELENPITEDMDSVRPNTIPSVLLALRESQGSPLPLKVFEIGEGGYAIGESLVGISRSLSMAVMDDSVSFEDIQAPVYSVLSRIGVTPTTRRALSKGLFVKGRTAELLANNEVVGVIGEVNPEVLVRLNIKYPVALACIDISRLYRVWSGLKGGFA